MAWKQITRDLALCHNADGHALIINGQAPEGWALQDTGLSLTVGGPTLTVRALRAWLWENRHHPAVSSLPMALWSVYDEESKQSTVGVGSVGVPEDDLLLVSPDNGRQESPSNL